MQEIASETFYTRFAGSNLFVSTTAYLIRPSRRTYIKFLNLPTKAILEGNVIILLNLLSVQQKQQSPD